jgi:hypothetical protein
VDSGDEQTRLGRAEKNEQAFKAHNERRAAVEEEGGVPRDEAVPFACECDDPQCARAVTLPLGEYEAIASMPDRFVVAVGHQDPAVEDVVSTRVGYTVVSKPSLKRRSAR